MTKEVQFWLSGYWFIDRQRFSVLNTDKLGKERNNRYDTINV